MDTIDLNSMLTNAKALGAYLSDSLKAVVSPDPDKPGRIETIRNTWNAGHKWRAFAQATITPLAWAGDILRASVVGVGVVVGGVALVIGAVGAALWGGALWCVGAARRGAERLVGAFNAPKPAVVQDDKAEEKDEAQA